jgi:hypothetical protein
VTKEGYRTTRVSIEIGLISFHNSDKNADIDSTLPVTVHLDPIIPIKPVVTTSTPKLETFPPFLIETSTEISTQKNILSTKTATTILLNSSFQYPTTTTIIKNKDGQDLVESFNRGLHVFIKYISSSSSPSPLIITLYKYCWILFMSFIVTRML